MAVNDRWRIGPPSRSAESGAGWSRRICFALAGLDESQPNAASAPTWNSPRPAGVGLGRSQAVRRPQAPRRPLTRSDQPTPNRQPAAAPAERRLRARLKRAANQPAPATPTECQPRPGPPPASTQPTNPRQNRQPPPNASAAQAPHPPQTRNNQPRPASGSPRSAASCHVAEWPHSHTTSPRCPCANPAAAAADRVAGSSGFGPIAATEASSGSSTATFAPAERRSAST